MSAQFLILTTAGQRQGVRRVNTASPTRLPNVALETPTVSQPFGGFERADLAVPLVPEPRSSETSVLTRLGVDFQLHRRTYIAMRKLIRILVAVALVGALAFVAPSAAWAGHGTDPDGAGPLPDNNPSGGSHEPAPLPAIANAAVPCTVEGEVSPGSAGGGEDHLVPPAGNDASHSHYAFISAGINCTDFNGAKTVTSGGGNDGHCLDVDDLATDDPSRDPGVEELLELSCHHPFNDHHGSTNESAWSNSSGYAAGTAGVQSNACADGDNVNKANIGVTPGPAKAGTGWVKYLRVGTALYVWGCFNAGSLGTDNPNFSAALAIYPPAPSNTGPGTTLPFCLIAPDFPVIGFLGTPTGCGFTIRGLAWRGTGWALDSATLPHP